VDIVADGTISNAVAKEILPELYNSTTNPIDIVKSKGLAQVSDAEVIHSLVRDVLARNHENIEKYKAGKTNLFGFFVGQVLKASGGTANPSIVKEVVQEQLDSIV